MTVSIKSDISPILTTIRSFEKLVFMRIGGGLTKQVDQIYKHVRQPYMTIDLEQYNFHFNHRKEETLDLFSVITRNGRNISYPHLKFFVDSQQFLLVVFLGKLPNVDLNVFEALLKFRHETEILLISISSNTTFLLEAFSSRGFSNVIIFNPNKMIYQTFQWFPGFAIQNGFGLPAFNSGVDNIYGKTLRVCVFPVGIRSIIYQINGQTQYGGWITSLIKSFIQYMNGTIEYQPVDDLGEAMNKLYSGEVDFITGLHQFPPIHSEKVSNHMFQLYWGMIMPSPKEIPRSLYIFKPMDVTVWLLYLSSIIYIATVVSISFHDHRDAFWVFFSLSFRAVIGQTAPCQIKSLRRIYIIIIVFGFVGLTWYSALLGSFLTTILYENTIRTLKDFIESPYKLYMNYYEYERNFNVEQQLHVVPVDKVLNTTLNQMVTMRDYNMDASNGYATGSDFWEYYINLFQLRFNLKRFVWNQYVLIDHTFQMPIKSDFFLKTKLNRFLHLSMDYGFFVRWLKYSFIEKRMTFSGRPFNEEIIIKELTLEYFEYAFQLVVGGWIFGMVLFVFEYLWRRWDLGVSSINKCL